MKLQVGVKVIIKNSDGLYLLIQRTEPLSAGTGITWDIPGGRINPDERLNDALAREVKEEVNMQLDGDIELLEAQDIFLSEPNFHIVRLTYSAHLDEDVELGSEHQDFGWVTLQEALALNIDPYLRRVLEGL